MSQLVNEFLTPRNIDIQSDSPLRARVTLEPLERGFNCRRGSRDIHGNIDATVVCQLLDRIRHVGAG